LLKFGKIGVKDKYMRFKKKDDNSDEYNNNVIYDINDIGYTHLYGGPMSRLFVSKAKEKTIQNLLTSLSKLKSDSKENVAVKKDSVL
jgi:hypothetical protein